MKRAALERISNQLSTEQGKQYSSLTWWATLHAVHFAKQPRHTPKQRGMLEFYHWEIPSTMAEGLCAGTDWGWWTGQPSKSLEAMTHIIRWLGPEHRPFQVLSLTHTVSIIQNSNFFSVPKSAARWWTEAAASLCQSLELGISTRAWSLDQHRIGSDPETEVVPTEWAVK